MRTTRGPTCRRLPGGQGTGVIASAIGLPEMANDSGRPSRGTAGAGAGSDSLASSPSRAVFPDPALPVTTSARGSADGLVQAPSQRNVANPGTSTRRLP